MRWRTSARFCFPMGCLLLTPRVCAVGCCGGAWLQRVADALLKVFGGSLALFPPTARPKADLLEQAGVPCFASHGLPSFLPAVLPEREAPLDPCSPRRVSPPILLPLSTSCPACYLPDEAKWVPVKSALDSAFTQRSQ